MIVGSIATAIWFLMGFLFGMIDEGDEILTVGSILFPGYWVGVYFVKLCKIRIPSRRKP